MPPHRRRPSQTSGPTPPIRRPKVAGRHNPGHTGEFPAIRPDQEPPPAQEEEAVTGVLDGVLGTPPRTEPDKPSRPRTSRTEDRPTPGKRAPVEKKPEDRPTRAARPEKAEDRPARAARPEKAEDRPARTARPEKSGPATKRSATEPRPARDSARPKPRSTPAGAVRSDKDRRPAGKRRATGSSRPENLAAAETGAGAEKPRQKQVVTPRSRASRQMSVAAVLFVAAVVLGGLAVFFRGQADGLTSGDTNTAMTDMGATTQVKSQLTEAINKTFSYNYTDLDSTAEAVRERLSDKALCEYNLLFGEVKKLAPQQQIILNTEVRDLGVVRIDGDRAEALVYIDQVSTRVDLNKTVSVRGQFAVHAQQTDGNWKITKFDMFGQPLFNGKPAPKC